MDGNLIRLDKLAFMATLQLIVPEIDNPNEIIAFGSGFFLIHKENLFLITADHIIHLDDHDEKNDTGQRMMKDYTPQILAGVNSKDTLGTMVIPIGGFYHLTGYSPNLDEFKSNESFLSCINKIVTGNVNIDDETLPINVRIADFLDFSVSHIKHKLPLWPLSTEIKDDKEIILEGGLQKLPLNSKQLGKLCYKNSYSVAGFIENKIINGCKLDSKAVEHFGLTFKGYDSEGNAILITPESPNINAWSGLSGAPVFDENGLLCAMLIRGPRTEPMITVVPIEKIIRFLEHILTVEHNDLVNQKSCQ